jgi:hypothetical protein
MMAPVVQNSIMPPDEFAKFAAFRLCKEESGVAAENSRSVSATTA